MIDNRWKPMVTPACGTASCASSGPRCRIAHRPSATASRASPSPEALMKTTKPHILVPPSALARVRTVWADLLRPDQDPMCGRCCGLRHPQAVETLTSSSHCCGQTARTNPEVRMAARILVAEDDPKQAHVIRMYLEHEGHSVLSVGDGRAALDQCRARKPDLVVLDVMMPLVGGLDVCHILRAGSGVPIILLTARSTENDILLGLDLGADDYVTKPYSPRQLVARIRALLRRSGVLAAGATREPLVVGDLVVDADRFEVRVDGRVIA